MRRLAMPLLLATALSATSAVAGNDLALTNPTAYIPPQCYTKTEDASGGVHNPCATCHVRSRAPNYINDPAQQMEWSFAAPARVNRWTNLFVDRRAAVAAVKPDDILAYVRTDNYRAEDGTNLLALALAHPPAGWDAEGDGKWSGYTPDVAFRFDDAGFDIGGDGRMTGWRAFSYTPLPGTFWPANGSADDVLIRLPAAYRQRVDGTPDRAVYVTNLAITEALIKRHDIAIPPTDEAAMGVDLDRDGVMGRATKVVFAFAPLDGITMRYAGRAGALQAAGKAPLAAGLYPLGTEFVHTVRYLDLGAAGDVTMAPRMKELRYMRKIAWQSYFDLEDAVLKEAKEKHDFPDRIRLYDGSAEHGIASGSGWRLQGFIEDAQGALRPQTLEETVFCMGCHGGVGVNDDSTFSFARKLGAEAPQRGWRHWTQGAGLRGVPDLRRADGTGDYAHYLRTNRAGDEFRGNMELIRAWLTAKGVLTPEKASAFRNDISALIYPSPERALALDAAYRMIVRDQSFAQGRDATIAPQLNVWRKVGEDQPTGIVSPEDPWFAP
ncbi:hypothetical protein [Acidimangrovimonas sediminis]|uniref:hypothetical protein n=1 Tax=Acidimangrovimonas sediminis TaxID=2056283 RepID=UPI0018EAFAFD|nr:hypothetical protein [Acidimangrovimonas sediminis]